MQRYGIIGLCALMLTLCVSCEGSFQSSVPTASVRVIIDRELGPFVLFQETAWTDYVIVDSEGFHYHGELVLPLGTNMFGYAGVIVYVSLNGYDAWDLACPYCAGLGRKVPCDIDGIYAVCPHCGEAYDLGGGSGTPRNGISKERLRQYHVTPSGSKLIVTQR